MLRMIVPTWSEVLCSQWHLPKQAGCVARTWGLASHRSSQNTTPQPRRQAFFLCLHVLQVFESAGKPIGIFLQQLSCGGFRNCRQEDASWPQTHFSNQNALKRLTELPFFPRNTWLSIATGAWSAKTSKGTRDLSYRYDTTLYRNCAPFDVRSVSSRGERWLPQGIRQLIRCNLTSPRGGAAR